MNQNIQKVNVIPTNKHNDLYVFFGILIYNKKLKNTIMGLQIEI